MNANAKYNSQAGSNSNSALSDCINGTGPFHKTEAASTKPMPSAPLRQIAASNAEALKVLEMKLRDIRGCSINSPCAESKSCPPDVCGLPSVEASLVETEYTINRLHSLADELLARL